MPNLLLSRVPDLRGPSLRGRHSFALTNIPGEGEGKREGHTHMKQTDDPCKALEKIRAGIIGPQSPKGWAGDK